MPNVYLVIHRRIGKSAGLSIVELMVVVAILSVLAAVGVPSFLNVLARYQTSVVADEMAGVLANARVEAIRRGGNVVLQKKNAGANPCPTAQQWSCGAVLWADVNRNGNQDAQDVVLKEIDVPGGAVVRNMSVGSAASITFNRWGQANGINALCFQVTRSGVADADRSVRMAAGGRVQVVDAVCP